MKKHTFYSLLMNGYKKEYAQKWNGYTDGTFNYYKNEFGYWYAIEPTTGMSVINYRSTRKECENAAHAPGFLEKVQNALTTDLQERFKKLVEIAEKEELQKCS